MAPKTALYRFEIEHEGKTYKCYREVSGVRVLEQAVTVLGVGSKPDTANYGQRGHPIVSMEPTARLIAHEILREKGIA